MIGLVIKPFKHMKTGKFVTRVFKMEFLKTVLQS